MDITWRNIRLICLREVRDQLRDRRTLFMVVVLPLLLYPGMGFGMLSLANLLTEQPRQVVVLGTENLPEPPLIENGHFSTRWFSDAETAAKLYVLTGNPETSAAVPNLTDAEQAEMIEAAHELQKLVQRRNEVAEQIAPWNPELLDELSNLKAAELRSLQEANGLPERTLEIAELETEFGELKARIGEVFAASGLQLLILVPDGLATTVHRTNEILASGDFNSQELHDLPLVRPVVLRNRASEKSDVAYHRVREALDKWEKQLLKNRLDLANLPETVPDPVSLMSIDVANQDEIAANLWAKIFPALLVIMALTGAFYPAVDLAAGEKERGTMETLLICPATRTEIVLGKFLTVLMFSMSTTLLNLVSMGFTGQHLVSAAAGATSSGIGAVPLPTMTAMFWLFVLLIPLAAFFSAVSLALATFARSNKEGQYYLTPLFMVTLGMTMLAMSPTIELSSSSSESLFYCAFPIIGPALLLKALLVNPGNTDVLVFGLPVLMSSVGYSLIALWWAVEQFKSEDVLFRESERFELRGWLRHLLRDKEPTPTSAQAATCFVGMMMLQFLAIRLMGGMLTGIHPEDVGRKILELAVTQQLALIAAPAIFMALLLTSSVRQSLKLRLPNLRMLGLAIALPMVLHPLAIELLSSLHRFFPQLPESASRAMAVMQTDDLPLWIILGAFALTPAICEEVAFRGFILTGFSRGGRVGVAIVLSSVMFGIIHMIPQQVFNATLIGLVLGLLAVRSRSLLTGVVFHFCFNSLAVMHSRVGNVLSSSSPEWLDSDVTRWFLAIQNDTLRYNFLTLLFCAGVAFILIRGLLREPGTRDDQAAMVNSGVSPLHSTV